ncbi:MAG: hypothetical protein K8T10_15400 [Candidatus Eremiobacteraeota bacterium]|nr:hypothetical protein [Candidatus Eremiobacteraeota bacterium]
MLVLGIIFAIVLVIALIVYISIKKTLSRQLGIKVELDPPHAEKGKNVKIKVTLNPKEATFVQSIAGTLFCRRYDEYKDSWQHKTDNTHLAKGKTITRTEFTFKENVELPSGKETKFGGIVPVPSEGLATEIRGMIQVHWFVTIHVKIPGSPNAEVQEELIVMRPHYFDAEEGAEREVDLYDPFYDANEEAKKIISIVSQEPWDIVAKPEDIVAEPEEIVAKPEDIVAKPEDIVAKPEEKVPVGAVTVAESIKTPQESDASKIEKKEEEKEEEEKPLPQTAILDKYKVKYRAPYDPTKFKKESRPVSSEEYMKSITSEEKDKKHAKPGAVADIYKKRYFVSSKDKDKKSKKINLNHIPEEYRAHHKLSGSSRDQKIIDEKQVPKEYRSGYEKPKKESDGKEDTGNEK